jgi:hypothetical protein
MIEKINKNIRKLNNIESELGKEILKLFEETNKKLNTDGLSQDVFSTALFNRNIDDQYDETYFMRLSDEFGLDLIMNDPTEQNIKISDEDILSLEAKHLKTIQKEFEKSLEEINNTIKEESKN